MATNHTANYNLNLWEPNDKFVRDEFNQDNAKIDAALKAEADARAAETTARAAADQDLENRKAAFVLLKEVNVTQQVSELSIDVSDINWGAWQYVFLDIDVDASGKFCLQVNGSGDNIFSSTGISSSTNGSLAGHMGIHGRSTGLRVQFNVCKAPDRRLSTLYPGGRGYSNDFIILSQVQTLNIVHYNGDPLHLGPTGTVRLWGLA